MIQGGISAETIQILIGGANENGARKDSVSPDTSSGDDHKAHFNRHLPNQRNGSNGIASTDVAWRSNDIQGAFDMAPGGSCRAKGRLSIPNPGMQRQVSYGLSTAHDPDLDDEDDLLYDDMMPSRDFGSGSSPGQVNRTLYFCGLPERATHKDLVSVLKGGKILSINMRGTSATVSFLEGAAEFLAWAKRNDIYMHTKRVSQPSTSLLRPHS